MHRRLGHLESDETLGGRFKECINVQYEAKLESFETTEFQNRLKPPREEIPEVYPSLLESDIREQMVTLMISIMPELGFETVWLAPGLAPVKFDGISTLPPIGSHWLQSPYIDYDNQMEVIS